MKTASVHLFTLFFLCVPMAAGTRDAFFLTTKNYHLKDFMYFGKDVGRELECSHLCVAQNGKCRSVNVAKKKNKSQKRVKCQLNNETKEINAESFVPDPSFNYYEPSYLQDGVLVPFHLSIKVNKNCADLFKNGARKDGIYTVSPDMKNSIKVKCDMTTDGGGWTVFQSRLDGSVDFFRDWNDYKNGFGEAEGEHWLGLDNIYRLCAISENVLTIDLEDFDGENRYAQYGIFEIGPEDQNYRLHVKNYLAGDAGDSFTRHNGMMFTTRDRDNDKTGNTNCAIAYTGAWWYHGCHESNLNGFYHANGVQYGSGTGINWVTWRGHYYSHKKTEMKFRPITFPY